MFILNFIRFLSLTLFICLFFYSGMSIAQQNKMYPIKGVSQALQQAKQMPSASLLDIKNRGKKQQAHFGSPFVYIGKTIGAPEEEKASGWMDEEKKRLFGTTQITKTELLPNGGQIANLSPQKPNFRIANTPLFKEITYKTPFGNTQTSQFIPHTTDFVSIIRVLDRETLLIEEHIYFIETKNVPFVRSILLNKPINTSKIAHPFELLEVKVDGKTIQPIISRQNSKEIILTNKDYLPAGFHTIYLRYLTKGSVLVKDGKGYIMHDMTGGRWNLPINRFVAYLTFPKQTVLFEKDILFGQNKLSIQDSTQITTDKQGNSLFILNNLLPAYASASIYASFHPAAFHQTQFEDILKNHLPLFGILFSISSVLIFLLLSAGYILLIRKHKKNTQRFIYKYHPLTLDRLYRVVPNTALLTDLDGFSSQFKQKKPLECKLYKTRFYNRFGFKYICSLMRYLRLSGEYWITDILLLIGCFCFIQQHDIDLTITQYILIISTTIILTILFFRYIGRREILRETVRFRQKLLNDTIFYGLSEQSVYNLYLKNYSYARVLNFSEQWRKNAGQHCPSLNKQD